MPNKMIYVAEADLPIFERARELAGGSLSALIARALRLYVQTEEARVQKPDGLKGKAGSDGEFMRQNFQGRRLAKQTVHTIDDRLVNQVVAHNARGKLVLYTKEIANWSQYDKNDWTTWDWDAGNYQLETYDTLEALKPHIAATLYDTVVRALLGTATPIDASDKPASEE